jgi:hypothetical protein
MHLSVHSSPAITPSVKIEIQHQDIHPVATKDAHIIQTT